MVPDSKKRSKWPGNEIGDDYKQQHKYQFRMQIELKLSEKHFFSIFFFSLNVLSFFAGPPDKLAEALIFTYKLKSGFRA